MRRQRWKSLGDGDLSKANTMLKKPGHPLDGNMNVCSMGLTAKLLVFILHQVNERTLFMDSTEVDGRERTASV